MTNLYPDAPSYQTSTEKPQQGYQAGLVVSPAAGKGGPEWTTTLTGCTDRTMGEYLYSWFCPQCALATMRTEYDGSSWCFNCLAINPVIARNMLRAGYGIEGSVAGDVCSPLCCGPCSTSQMLHEVRARGPIKNVSQPNTEPWRHGLCSFDLVACLFGCFLPNCGLATARNNFDDSSWLLNCCCLPPAFGRNLIREGYSIEGDCCSDICSSMWCLPCVVSQLYQETKSRGKPTHPGAHHMK